jgi:uncharacterized protein YkwD
VDNSLPRVADLPEPTDAPGRRRLAAAFVAVALAVTALVGGAAVSASPAGATSVEDVFTTKINQARAARGIPRLTPRAHLIAVARDWAATMAAQAKLYHNPQLTSDVNNWRYVGENVGYGPDALTVHVAFMNSPAHRANVLDRDYTEVGIGAVVRDGRVWVAEVFRRPARVTTSAVSTSGFPGKLTYGSTGTAVQRVQGRLGLATTGFYGSYTKAAVSRFQKHLGWRGRGNVGRHTWARLF